MFYNDLIENTLRHRPEAEPGVGKAVRGGQEEVQLGCVQAGKEPPPTLVISPTFCFLSIGKAQTRTQERKFLIITQVILILCNFLGNMHFTLKQQ